MTLHNFIFSNEPKSRISRHLLFWLIFSFHFIIQNLMIGGPGEGKTSRSFLESFLHFLYFFPVYFAATYFLLEVLLPKFVYKQNWAAFILSFLLLFSVTYLCIY